jgi:hypothetical protein
MKRMLDNLRIDFIAAALLVAMVATGYILRFPLPPGTNKSLGLWGLTRHQWGAIHFWISLGLLVLIVAHVCLHWQWIVLSVKRRLGSAALPSSSPFKSGLLTALILCAALALFGWAAHCGVRPITAPIEAVCSPEDELAAGELTKEVLQAAPDYWRDVYPVLERRCSSCHGPRKQISNFRVDRRKAFFEGVTPLIVPGDSAGSPLLEIISGNRTRADVHRLPPKELAAVRSWIDAGADWPAPTTN